MRTRRIPSSSDPVAPATSHRSVLLHESLEALAIGADDTVVDATLGGAGHAKEIIGKLGQGGSFIGFDLDLDAINRAEATLVDAPCRTLFINANFRDIRAELAQHGVENIDKALFDLGWSADQLGSGRGFSFLKDEPLLMTYAKESSESGLTAATIVNEWSESSIADILFGWGEERYSRRIAAKIVERRSQKPFTSSLDLAETIRNAVPAAYARGRLHPATRTFQALRIAVNDELGALREGIAGAWDMLALGGRLAVITFHSIEDREVKRMFTQWEKAGAGRRIMKKPVVASLQELRKNARARSAKLRAIEKLP